MKNSDITKDVFNSGDSIWLKAEELRKGVVLEVNKKDYVIAFYVDSSWKITNVKYENIFPRVRDIEPGIFQPFDVVYITEGNVKSLGVVVGFEENMYVVYKYATEIWRRVIAPGISLTMCHDNYDQQMFINRKELTKEEWIKWELP